MEVLRYMTLKEITERMFLQKSKIYKWVRKYHIGVQLPDHTYRFNENDFYKLKEIEQGGV